MSTADIRSRVKMSDADIVKHFRRLGFEIAIQELVFTSEPLKTSFSRAKKSGTTAATSSVTKLRGS
jgi:hypothetical protein